MDTEDQTSEDRQNLLRQLARDTLTDALGARFRAITEECPPEKTASKLGTLNEKERRFVVQEVAAHFEEGDLGEKDVLAMLDRYSSGAAEETRAMEDAPKPVQERRALLVRVAEGLARQCVSSGWEASETHQDELGTVTQEERRLIQQEASLCLSSKGKRGMEPDLEAKIDKYLDAKPDPLDVLVEDARAHLREIAALAFVEVVGAANGAPAGILAAICYEAGHARGPQPSAYDSPYDYDLAGELAWRDAIWGKLARRWEALVSRGRLEDPPSAAARSEAIDAAIHAATDVATIRSSYVAGYDAWLVSEARHGALTRGNHEAPERTDE